MNQARPTDLLRAWGNGDESALAELIPLVHGELRTVARRCMAGERRSHILQATALVNEAYMRLIDVRHVGWQNRAHFLSMAARLMRRVLVESARTRDAEKRGRGRIRVTLDEGLLTTAATDADVIALDLALDKLAAFDARKSQVVEMRFFGGLTIEETANALAVSVDTVMRDWRLARAWLLRELGGPSNDEP